CHSFFYFPHLFAARLIALLLFDFLCPLARNLRNNAGREQFLLASKGKQIVTAYRVDELFAPTRSHPAEALLFQTVRGLKHEWTQLFVKLRVIEIKRSEPVYLQILEPHDGKKAKALILTAPIRPAYSGLVASAQMLGSWRKMFY